MYVVVPCVADVGCEIEWQSMHCVGCVVNEAWYAPVCHKVDTAGVVAALPSAFVWQLPQFWKLICVDWCCM
jgi:hypothetical protein